MLHRELWTILAHCYNAFVAYSISLSVIHKGKRIDGNKVYYIYTLLLSFLMANIFLLTLFRIGLSGTTHGCWVGRGKRAFLPKICHTYPTMMKFSTVIPYINKIKKNINHVSQTYFLLTSSFFHRKSAAFVISKNADAVCILIHNF